ncbi:unspecific monooxygenase [Ancylostoma duodenale]|uniref:Unspecific monooxygenase n=1 Tax=Ancylostoma duodenale TaxID=51022 RepID=A0A0C2GIR3_9BILA|nr:unspecific monooxygenase [Ancylostoma duodenale]
MLIEIVLTTILIYYLSDQWRRTTRLPPGPYPILFLGNLPQLLFYSWKYGGIVPGFKYIKKKYGPVFTIWFGPLPTVHIADYTLSHEAMVRYGAKYQDRWSPAMMIEGRGDRGVIVSNGQIWQEQRRFSLHVLRNLGVSRNLMEERIMDEFNLRFDEIDQLPVGSPVNPSQLFDRLVGGVINRMLFSVPIDEKEEMKFYVLKKELDRFVEVLSFSDVFVKKWMLKVPFLGSTWTKKLQPVHDIKAFIRKQIEERKRAIDDGSHMIDEEPKDYTDAFIQKMRQDAEEGVKDSSFDDESLVVNILDLWTAGQETTSTTLVWAMVFLLKDPEVANKVREELLRVTHCARPLSLKDKPETPYFIATLTEIQRIASILNLNIFRLSNADAEIGGYSVPKNTVVSAELSLILADDDKFLNPSKFDPSRFITDPSLASSVIPFGLGRRACLGEALARAELYLILGNLLLRYSLRSVGGPPPTAELNKFGIMRKPQHFQMIFNKIA